MNLKTSVPVSLYRECRFRKAVVPPEKERIQKNKRSFLNPEECICVPVSKNKYTVDPCRAYKDGACMQFVRLRNVLSDKQICFVMERHHYNELNAALIAGDFKLLHKKYSWIIDAGGFMDAKRADSRSPVAYRLGVVCGWIMEDYIKDCVNHWFYKYGCPVSLLANGTDKDRVIQTGDSGVSNDPDYCLCYKKHEVLIEECTSYTGIFTKINNSKVTLRNKKRKHLLEHQGAALCVETKGGHSINEWRYVLLGSNELKQFVAVDKDASKYRKKSDDVYFDSSLAVDFDILCQILYYAAQAAAGESPCLPDGRHMDFSSVLQKGIISCIRDEVIAYWKNQNMHCRRNA